MIVKSTKRVFVFVTDDVFRAGVNLQDYHVWGMLGEFNKLNLKLLNIAELKVALR